jgi:catechol 2,3-dioxygenase
MATLPLDVQAVLGALDGGEPPFEQLPRDTTMGHVHLQVADIASTERFYTEQLGFDLQARYGDQASFLSAGGYHHHLGANVWNSRGASPPPPGSASLRKITIVLPDDEELNRVIAQFPDAERDPDTQDVLVEDPSGNKLAFRVPPK